MRFSCGLAPLGYGAFGQRDTALIDRLGNRQGRALLDQLLHFLEVARRLYRQHAVRKVRDGLDQAFLLESGEDKAAVVATAGADRAEGTGSDGLVSRELGQDTGQAEPVFGMETPGAITPQADMEIILGVTAEVIGQVAAAGEGFAGGDFEDTDIGHGNYLVGLRKRQALHIRCRLLRRIETAFQGFLQLA